LAPHRTKRALLLASLVLVVGVSGCTSDRAARPSPAPGTPSASAGSSSAAPSEPTGPPAYGAVVADRAEVHPGTISVTGARRSVADALVSYLRVRFTAYHRAAVDQGALTAVARGSAVDQVRSYVRALHQKQQHTVGEVWVDVGTVRIRGGRATLTSCLRNASADADEHDRVVERDVPSAYDVRATAVHGAHGPWLIDTIRFDGRPGCGTG
jgi:hypothetical protein